MKIKLITDEFPDLLPMQGRSRGVHVSDVVKSWCLDVGVFRPGFEERLDTTWCELGNALEESIIRRYERHHPGRFVKPGELELDGLYGTPDLQDLQQGTYHEIKLSWYSSRVDPCHDPRFKRYIKQLMSYCWMGGVAVGVLDVFHVHGDYKENWQPQYHQWELQFSDVDLIQNWAEMLARAELLRKKGKV